MEISIERSPLRGQHWCPSVVSNSQPLDPELDALDHSATAPINYTIQKATTTGDWGSPSGLLWCTHTDNNLRGYLSISISATCPGQRSSRRVMYTSTGSKSIRFRSWTVFIRCNLMWMMFTLHIDLIWLKSLSVKYNDPDPYGRIERTNPSYTIFFSSCETFGEWNTLFRNAPKIFPAVVIREATPSSSLQFLVSALFKY